MPDLERLLAVYMRETAVMVYEVINIRNGVIGLIEVTGHAFGSILMTMFMPWGTDQVQRNDQDKHPSQKQLHNAHGSGGAVK